MQRGFSLRNRVLAAALLGAALGTSPTPAHAASKEIIELQTQVQQLLDMVQRLQSTMDARFGVLQHLAEQTADNANRMSSTVNTLQQKLAAQNDAITGKLDTDSGQVQSLNDSVDELKSRVTKIDKQLQEMQGLLQNMQSPASAPAMPGANSAGPAPGAPVAQVPPLKETFQAGLRDYNAAKFDVAAGEFQDVVHYYPLDDTAGSAEFYLGEIAYKQQNFPDAIKAYNDVIENFSGNAKAPAAQLHKGYSLIQTGKKEAGINELRSLIKRHPQTPEAAQAKSKLTSLGTRASTR